MNTRCKVGDLVVVIGPSESHVLRLMGTVRHLWDGISRIGGHLFFIDRDDFYGPSWVVELAAPTTLKDTGGDSFLVRLIPYDDKWLHPIRGNMPAVDQEVEKCLTAS